MECSCNIEVDNDDGGPEFYSEAWRTARKVHKCYECGRKIEPGEKYEVVSGVWDGDFETYKTCNDCHTARSMFFPSGYSFGMMWQDIVDYIGECDGEIPEKCISGLTQRSRDRVLEQIERCFDD